jgi:hypothetical protein
MILQNLPNLTPSQAQVMDIVGILYGALTAILFLFGAELLERYLKADKQTRGDAAYLVFFVISMTVIGYGLYMLLSIANNGFITDVEKTDGTFALGLFFIIVNLTPLSTICEKVALPRKKINISLIVGILVITYTLVITILEFNDPSIVNSAVWWIPTLLGLLIFSLFSLFGIIIIFFVRLRPQKEISKKFLIGLICGLIGLAFAMHATFVSRGQMGTAYIIDTIMEIVGWLALRHFILSIPSYSELEWRHGMIELHVIMAETGISLYYRSFRRISPEALKGDMKVEMTIPEQERPNTDLIGGGMIGIKTMLGEIAGTKGKLESIQIGEMMLNFKQGETVLCLLLSDVNLGVYHSLLLNAVQEIEAAHPQLANFNGDTRQLHIAEIIDRIFGAEEKKKV